MAEQGCLLRRAAVALDKFRQVAKPAAAQEIGAVFGMKSRDSQVRHVADVMEQGSAVGHVGIDAAARKITPQLLGAAAHLCRDDFNMLQAPPVLAKGGADELFDGSRVSKVNLSYWHFL